MNKNYFSLLNEGSVQMHGFEHLSDTFYVKPLVTKNSLTIYATPHSDCLEIMLDTNRKIKQKELNSFFADFICWIIILFMLNQRIVIWKQIFL